MRFSRLDLSGIPARGIIGIEGPNESGKTTLGEALLFALFGSTRASAEAPVQSLIRWGSDAMSVEVELAIEPSLGAAGGGGTGPAAGAREYLLFRQIDRAGTNYVKVIDLASHRQVAAGNIQVAEFIAREIRFDFEEFQRSFYHDQCEGRRLHALNGACFESATGVKHLHDAAAEVRRETEALEREFSYYQKEITRNLAQIQKYARGAAKLAELGQRASRTQEALGEGARRAEELRGRIDGLRAEAAARNERIKRIDGLLDGPVESFAAGVGAVAADGREAAGKGPLLADEAARVMERRSREGLEGLRALSADLECLLDAIRSERAEIDRRLGDGSIAGIVGERRVVEEAASRAAWSARARLLQAAFLLVLAVVSALLLAARLRAVELDFGGSGQLAWLPWTMGAIAAVAAAGFAGMLLAASWHRGERRRSLARLADLSAEIAGLEARRAALEVLGGSTAARDAGRLAEGAASSGEGPVAERGRAFLERWRGLLPDGAETGLAGAVASLAKIERDLRSRLLAEAQRNEKLAQDDAAQEKKLLAERDRIEGEAGECRSQSSKKDALEEKNRELEVSAAEVRSGIDLRLQAAGLLEDAARSIRTRLGPALGRLVKSLIPRLTSGRYRDVKVDEDFAIQVFSSDKNDFLLLHELSGGTSQALRLALRLALSQALVAARSRQLQFVFLDEPFQMMDSRRAAETLRILRVLSPDLAQFFVIQPNFSEEERRLFDSMVLTRPDGTDLAAALGAAAAPGAEPPPVAAGLGAEREGPAPHVAD